MKIVKRKDSDRNLPFYNPSRSIFDDFFSVPTIFDEMFDRSFMSKNVFADIWEEGDNYFVKMAMPGVSKDDINISISEDSVTISAHTQKEEKSEENDNKKYYCKTMESSYEQTFNLPTKVDSESADAKYEEGVLTLTLPKAEDVKPKKIQVK